MVALFTDAITGEAKGIHRTALSATGGKIGRMTLGPIGGCVIRLWPDGSVEQGLVLGEGIEFDARGGNAPHSARHSLAACMGRWIVWQHGELPGDRGLRCVDDLGRQRRGGARGGACVRGPMAHRRP